MAYPRLSITGLPDEIIQQILYYVPPASIPSLQQASKRFSDLTDEPLLWRYYCSTRFKYWSPEHDIKQKFGGYVTDVDWKKLYEHRCAVDRTTRRIIDSILASQMGRIEKFERIAELGYDAKDTLIQQYRVGDDAEDALARRYYSDSVLGYLHRTLAIKEWSKFKVGESVTLERALAAYDMFVLHDREGDFSYISDFFDDLAGRIQHQHCDFSELTLRAKATAIAGFLIAHNLTGLRSERTYRDLQNSFIAIALQTEDHPSVPLISTTIFCCVAQRLGLDARPCGIPFHVYAMVFPTKGSALDGKVLQEGEAGNPMYMDPFRSAQEIPIDTIKAQLSEMGATASSHSTFLQHSTITEIVLRSGRNIMNSVQYAHSSAVAQHTNHGSHHLTMVSNFPDMESAFYGALWASILVGIPSDGDGSVAATVRRRQYLPYILEHFETHFPTDIGLIERYIVPLFQHLPEYDQLSDTVRVIRAGDTMPKQVKGRTEDNVQHVRFKVGEAFRHKRYNYLAIITGWDVECGAGEHWMQQMGVDQLSQGRQQSFYHVLYVTTHAIPRGGYDKL
ncbi:MAG: hypothetical protein M1830_002521 [Pleopsidium flavum]|nr:MAG: hypothetical protein M1830_002521 [Pleopsidium flavum]